MSKTRSMFFALLLPVLMPASGAAAGAFTLEGFFAGKSKAVGSFSAINGVKRKFTVDLTGKWDGKTLTLREDFVFDDGTRDTKTWRFVKTGPASYSGTREDVIGETKVTLQGNVARFNYLVYLDSARQANKVRFYDKMVLRSDGSVLNTALVTKFGLPVAKTVVEFER
ncbi:DUF3833 family protein [Ciceribacter selenitireducens]|uniref:DUF3833 domain-containing protein n=1 Tax=Ciceribacter selenitireducens ATCC BAA-1503 TaxID=1336235 RepID=A0A376AHG6_9HYPH|nr:DUF3833 family protein [Ciceribacter selenitireducens]SSC67238.1 unnamed protein product [Ciceribacter selenitireducens ATCC BAA-1503]